MISFEESMEIMGEIRIASRQTKKCYLTDTLGFVLASDIIADHDSPQYPTSAMDGYAVRHEDVAMIRLPISAINPAGSGSGVGVGVGESIKTFTGSLMPHGSDTLIPIENVTVEGKTITIHTPVPKGFAVRAVGENFSRDQILIPRNTPIDFPQIGVMASLGIVAPLVYAKPTVALLSTGSELLELGQIPTNPSQIRSSNNYILEAIVRKYGGEPLQLGCIGDDKGSIMEALDHAMKHSDIVITTGGVSVGDFDFVKDVIRELGCEVLFQGVRLKPGQHIMVAQKGDTFIIGLPGFAYSSTVTALLYALPLIALFQNTTSPLQYTKATLTVPLTKQSNKSEFIACNLTRKDGKFFVDFDGKKGGSSAILTNMLGSTALLCLDEGQTNLAIGDEVDILLL